MSVINTNTIALNSQRNLATNSANLSTTIQRLSSGLRINSAKDDAAGLAISERFTTQIRGMNQAARNANDGISLAQTAEGALGEIGNNLQRIRELAVQSRNATNSASDRQALNAEVEQLKSEIQRVAEQTQFNGTNLLDGSFTGAVFQVGANQGQTISVDNIANASTASLGGDWSRGARHESDSLTAATVTDGTLATSITINDQVISIDAAAGRSEGDALAALATRFAEVKAGDGADALANVSMAADGTISFTDASVVVADLTNVAGVTAGTHANTGAELSPAFTGTGFADEDILTADNADRMILAMDAALDAVNSSRADLGAIQNRFSSVVANLQTSSENLSASRSRIMDTDFAKETAELSRTQILQQAGTAMLAQANQIPQNVLSLLR